MGCQGWASHIARATMNHCVTSILISTLGLQMTHLWKSASFALAAVAIFMLMHSPVPTSPLEHTSSFTFSFYSIYFSVSACLLFCQPPSRKHPPTHSSRFPQPPFLSAATLSSLPLGKEMRRVTHANILDPLLLPDSSPLDRNRDGGREEGRGGRDTAFTQKTDFTQSIQLIGAQWGKK